VLAAYRQLATLRRAAARRFRAGTLRRRAVRLVLACDPIGIRPLYHCRVGQSVLFASEIKALFAHPGVPRGPDDDSLAEFLIGRVPESREATFFRGVSSLPPAHTAIVTPDGFGSRRYWDFDPGRGTRYASFPECAEAFREQFERAVHRRLRSAHPVATVSG
jgi:asparagine synthase (glutamine-hydrolysing)